LKEEYEMTRRRRFSAEFKARAGLEALRGDKTIQQIASKHKVHSNQVSRWKRQVIEGLGQGFSGKNDKACKNQEAEIHELRQSMCPGLSRVLAS
jgi:transposase